MSTLRQIEANRRKAQKSTGPTSVTGKAVSSMNALKTGIHAKSLVIPSENVAELELLIEEHYHRHQPASPEARDILDDLIYCEWTLRRLRAADAEMYKYQNEDKFRDSEKYPLGKSASYNSSSFSKLQYRLDATRRARLRNLQTLKQLQAEVEAAPAPAPAVEPPVPTSLTPSPQTTSPQIGFVPSTPTAAPPQPAPAPPSPAPNPPVAVTPGALPGRKPLQDLHDLHDRLV